MPTNNAKKIKIELSSGRQLIVSRIMLFPESEVLQIISLKAKAQEEMGGISSATGFLGPPEWAIGGAIALGVVGALISNSKTKKGFELLKEAATKTEKLKLSGIFFDISSIEGIANPIPTRWRAMQNFNFQINLEAMTLGDRGKTLRQYNLSKDQIIDDKFTVNKNNVFIINEEKFLSIEDNEQQIEIRWSSVESYQVYF